MNCPNLQWIEILSVYKLYIVCKKIMPNESIITLFQQYQETKTIMAPLVSLKDVLIAL